VRQYFEGTVAHEADRAAPLAFANGSVLAGNEAA
jgi:hypothetical protein